MEEDNGFDLEGLTVTQATELVLLRSRIGALGASENEQRRILQEARSGLEDLLNGPHVASVLRTLSVLARQASEKITADIVPAEEEDQLDLIVQETAESLIRTLDDLHHQYQYLAQNIDAGDDDTTLDFIRERHGEFRRRIVDLVHRRVAAEWLLNHKELREALWDFELALVRAEKDLGRTGWVRDSRFASDTNDFLSAIYGVDQRSPSRDPPRLGHAE